MATEIFLTRIQNNCFSPSDEQSQEAVSKIKLGSTIRANIVQPRNIAFHRKLFALLNLGFDYFEPPDDEWQGVKAEKSFEVFRQQVTILAGYRIVTYNLDGSVKIVAESISFGSMDEVKFEKLYNAVFSVIWRKVLSQHEKWSEAEMRRVLANLESFT